MSKKIKRICIRGLKAFEKNGCPQSSACPAWKELLVTPRNEPLKPKDKIGRCLDDWNVELQITALALLEGNQRATESFRNNMSVAGSPKPDPGIGKLLGLMEQRMHDENVLMEHERKKQIEGSQTPDN